MRIATPERLIVFGLICGTICGLTLVIVGATLISNNSELIPNADYVKCEYVGNSWADGCIRRQIFEMVESGENLTKVVTGRECVVSSEYSVNVTYWCWHELGHRAWLHVSYQQPKKAVSDSKAAVGVALDVLGIVVSGCCIASCFGLIKHSGANSCSCGNCASELQQVASPPNLQWRQELRSLKNQENFRKYNQTPIYPPKVRHDIASV